MGFYIFVLEEHLTWAIASSDLILPEHTVSKGHFHLHESCLKTLVDQVICWTDDLVRVKIVKDKVKQAKKTLFRTIATEEWC